MSFGVCADDDEDGIVWLFLSLQLWFTKIIPIVFRCYIAVVL